MSNERRNEIYELRTKGLLKKGIRPPSPKAEKVLLKIRGTILIPKAGEEDLFWELAKHELVYSAEGAKGWGFKTTERGRKYQYILLRNMKRAAKENEGRAARAADRESL